MSNPAMNAKLGVTFDNGVGAIRVYSASATDIWLVILDSEDPSKVINEIALHPGEYDIWNLVSAEITPGMAYGLRADGPVGPRHGFNKDLILIDPYARGVKRINARDYYCVAVSDEFDWQGVTKPNTPMDQVIIYEAHARGLTRNNPEIPDDLRGTYAGLAHPSTIAHLKKIGVTSVELLPIHQLISEPHLIKMGLYNYWGYNTINYFAPHHRYATISAQAAGPQAMIDELKTAIRELHRAGIEVILDVVYNHTAEGGSRGITYSYRGLDSSNYYRQDDAGNYHDTTGCGNSLNFGNPHVVDLVIDSLRYWANEMQVDGFRFDLATTLARDESNTFDPHHPLLRRIVEDETLAGTKMIAEPWDVGLGGWQTGGFPDRFSEWNDRFRDTVRRFWLTDISNARNSGQHWNGVGELATRLSGSRDIFDGPSGPLGSINFITAHDGFTLHDLVSYNVKHNQANGEGNRDGTTNNYSFNHGFEGENADAETMAQRRKSARNLMATLLLSAGVPMITAGDERLKTQMGNNNAYCQDTVMSWVNWELTAHQRDFEDSIAELISLRKAIPALRPDDFAGFDAAHPDQALARWYNIAGEIMTAEDWNGSETRVLVKYGKTVAKDGSISEALIVINGAEESVEVKLPLELVDREFSLTWDSADERPLPQPIKTAGATQLDGPSIQLFTLA
ncbi:MAG: glycogen debranching protein GlgX [Micrococcales bacterium]